MPMVVPSTMEISAAANPTNSEMREPSTTSDSTETPSTWVPSGYFMDGPARRGPLTIVGSSLPL